MTSLQRFPRRARYSALLLVAAAVACCSSAVRADICLSDMWDNGTLQAGFVFPNWSRVEVGSFDVLLCYGCTWQATERLVGLTVVNFGTGTNVDIRNVYWEAKCGATTTGLQTMSFRGTYTQDSGSYPAWTWAGSSAELAACPEMWVGGPGYFTIHLYADVSECPTPQSSIAMGFSTNQLGNTTWWGSVWDNAGCAVPWGDTSGPSFDILYTLKQADVPIAAPGDTVAYTIYYGRPGTVNLTGVEIVDTQPPFTHYVPGTASPLPEPGWDPNPGPPTVLKWTIPPPHPVAGGPTDEVTFQLSVDWGNGEGFEPGSGDVAAPEGERLDNRAQVFFRGITGCGRASVVNPPVTTVARRFLFWKLGDNDVLYSPTIGQSPDEMIYSIYIKNRSATRTWWNVQIWDTVPSQLDVWCADCGFYDPCLGWTMTPNGCPSAYPGWRSAAGSTMLSWRLDMPPGLTLNLQWKGKVKPTAVPDDTAVNKVNLLAMGRNGVVNGTGYSGKVASFMHLAPIVLATTYVSYVAYAASDVGDNAFCGQYISFFPMNKKSQFELRGLQYVATGIATAGGLSASIGSLLGDCLGGFPGGGGMSGGGYGGCKAERAPAHYRPVAWEVACPTLPSHFIYKITSNSPVLWQLLVKNYMTNNDSRTYAPSTTLTYVGLMHYFYRRYGMSNAAGYGDSPVLINTGRDGYGTLTPGLTTTVHIFRWDTGTSSWEYVRTREIDKDSMVLDMGTIDSEEGEWRTISSDAQLIVEQQVNNFNTLGCCCGNCGDNYGSLMPNGETGNVVSGIGTGTFYGTVQRGTNPQKMIIGNMGTVDAEYRLWRYIPNNTVAVAPLPSQLNDSSGVWVSIAQHVVPAGQANAGNPRRYAAFSTAVDAGSIALYKVELLSGGPIQVVAGEDVYSSWGGGAVMHSADGNQTGTEFWLHQGGAADDNKPCSPRPLALHAFCPKTGMAIRCTGEGGYTATYTTTGPDQCVVFGALTPPSPKRNYKVEVLASGAQARVICQYQQCMATEKGFTAPFLSTGVHYQIIMPPVVFSGQSFWITIVVLESGGATKTDYDGITSFSGTDPGAKIEGTGMAGYDYNWAGVPAENGVRIFVNVVFNVLGLQSLVATDTEDGSIAGVASTMVVGADVKLLKDPRFTIASSGETIQFRVCWSNYSSATANAFVITDAVPMGTSYVPEAASLMFCGSNGPATPTVTVAYGTASATTPASFNTLTSPTQTAPSNTRWLRWTIQDVYVYSTGCVCFRTKVD